MNKRLLSIASVLALAAPAARAATLVVPSPAYPTIQSAVDGSTDGDTIEILPGTYYEHVVLNSRNLTLTKIVDAESPIIDGGNSGTVLTITGGSYALVGLTLTHGSGPRWGGAIDMEGGTVRMERCVVRDNRSAYVGGIGLFGRYASTRLDAIDTQFLDNHSDAYAGAVFSSWGALFTCDRCTFERNRAEWYAGAIYAAVGYAFVNDSVFDSNSAAGDAGAVFAMGGGYATLDRCTLRHNTAGGAGGAGYATAAMRVVNSLLVDNTAAAGGALASTSSGSLMVGFSTITGNHAPTGGGIYAPDGYLEVEDSIVQGNDAPPVLQPDRVHYSNVEGGFAGAGNVDADCFADPAAGNYAVRYVSVCMDAANPASGQTVDRVGAPRPQGLGFDMGAFENPAHVLTASFGPGGGIWPTGTIAVLDGAAQLYSIRADAGYHVADVLVDGSSVGPVTSYVFDRVTSDHSISATFAVDRWVLSVTPAGTGGGTVTSSPAGIACSAPCSATYDGLTTVTLTAAPRADSFFAGWAGACTGTGPCTLVMDGDRAATATFTQFLTVDSPGAGETWTRGSISTIKWRYAGNPGSTVRIELLRGNAVVKTIAASAPIGASGLGSLAWQVPSSLAAASGYRIRITSTTLAAATDVSDGSFRIR